MRIIGGYQNTNLVNGEDFAITPYLFAVSIVSLPSRIYGFGLCWGYYAVFISVGFNVPKSFPPFRQVKRKA